MPAGWIGHGRGGDALRTQDEGGSVSDQDVAFVLDNLKIAHEDVLRPMLGQTEKARAELECVSNEAASAMTGELFGALGPRFSAVVGQVTDLVQHTATYEDLLLGAVRMTVRRYAEAEAMAAELLNQVWSEYRHERRSRRHED
jgi:hypothetical protein